MHTEKQIRWRETHLLTADKKALARFVLDEIRRGRDVTKTIAKAIIQHMARRQFHVFSITRFWQNFRMNL